MTKGIPEGMHTVTPVLCLDGASEAIELYKKAFGAQERGIALDPSGKKVLHAAIAIGDSTVFLNDPFPEMGALAQPSKLWLYFEDVGKAFKRASEAGMKVLMPPADMFWGDRYGRVGDRWGNEWGMAQRTADLTPEQMKAAEKVFMAQMAAQKKK